MRVPSKVGNLPSKFGHARPLGSRIIRYVHDGRTDGQTDADGRTKAKLIVPFPTGGAIISDLGVFALPHFLWVIVGLRLVVNTSAVSCLE